MGPRTEKLIKDDAQYLWHPFTQMSDWRSDEELVIVEGKGCELIDSEGRRYIDGVSSLWCNIHGHRHPVIDGAIKQQLGKIAHTTMLGLTHPTAVELAKKLVEITPAGLNKVFYSDSGSTATEIALKMAFQYWQQQGGEQADKRLFVRLENSYHGDTLGAVSVGGIELFHKIYEPLLFKTLEAKAGDIDSVAHLFEQHHGKIAAVIMEPLIQGAAGMLEHPPGFLSGVRQLCNDQQAFLICDEVATGFGRTGKMFACEHEGVAPDFLCLAKGLSGGYLPLAATLTTDEIYQGFLGAYSDFRSFFHGHTYTGNPLACAAALATIEVFESERTIEHLQTKIELLRDLLAPLESHPNVFEVRQCGMMVGIELAQQTREWVPFPIEKRVGHQVTVEAREHGVIVRPLGDVIVLMPPLVIDEQQLRILVDVTSTAIDTVVEKINAKQLVGSVK